jgi:hypothetical protein
MSVFSLERKVAWPSRELAAGDRLQDMKSRSCLDCCVEALEITDVLAIQEDVHIRAEFTGFVAEIEAQTWEGLIEGHDNLMDGPAGDRDRGVIARTRAERVGKAHCSRRKRS